MKAKEWKTSVCLRMMITNNTIQSLHLAYFFKKNKQTRKCPYLLFLKGARVRNIFNKIHSYLNEG